MTTKNTKSSTLNIQTQVTFGTTHIVDKTIVMGLIDKVKGFNFKEAPTSKATVFGQMILQAYEANGLEAATEVYIQYVLREAIKLMLNEEFAGEQEKGHNVRVSPVRVQILDTVHNTEAHNVVNLDEYRSRKESLNKKVIDCLTPVMSDEPQHPVED